MVRKGYTYMLTRRPLKNVTGKLAAALIGLSATIGAVPASAQICGLELAQNEELADAANRGGAWVGAGSGQVPTLLFRVRGGCVEVSAPGWGWMPLTENPDIEGSYEATVSRRGANGLMEAVDLRLRFAGGPEVGWIEFETWLFANGNRSNPKHTYGTLFHRP